MLAALRHPARVVRNSALVTPRRTKITRAGATSKKPRRRGEADEKEIDYVYATSPRSSRETRSCRPTPDGASRSVDLRHGDPDALVRVVQLRDHLPPRIYDDRVPVRRPPLAVHAALRGGDDVRLRLDRPRAQEHLPVRRAGGTRKRGRHEHHARAALVPQRAEQLRETKIVAYHHPETADRGVRGDDLRAGRRGLRFHEQRAVRDVHVEEMDLSVARAYLAVRVHEHVRVQPMSRVRAELREPAQGEPDVFCPGEISVPRHERPVQGFHDRQRVLALASDEREALGEE
eukprot:29979-Pelagococcus_subviridis.AAC.6